MSKQKVDKGKVCVEVERTLDRLAREAWEYSEEHFENLNDKESEIANRMMSDLLAGNGPVAEKVEAVFEQNAEGAVKVKDFCLECVGDAHTYLRKAAVNHPKKKIRSKAFALCDRIELLAKEMGHPFLGND